MSAPASLNAQAVPPAEGAIRLLVLGDSLSAGYGLPANDAFPAQLERALRAKGHNVNVINAGVSGDTSAGGRARLDWSLADNPQAAIVELGANDGLRGIEPKSTAENLDAILAGLKAKAVPTLLAGMLAPPNLGAAYGKEFNAIYPSLAKTHGVALYPFFLDGVAAEKGLNQADGMHPNAKGVAVIVDRILPAVEKLLAAVKK
ncbi:MAG TPA: arylesterase [Alphaproteobacteria bacterium]|nr:arylesterase [Alphaproteobacteria bacterium]